MRLRQVNRSSLVCPVSGPYVDLELSVGYWLAVRGVPIGYLTVTADC